MDQALSRRDLLLALLAHRRYRNSHPDVASYQNDRYVALARAFDFDVDPLVPPHQPSAGIDHGIYLLFMGTISAYERVRSPWDGFIETLGSVAQMFRQHGGRIRGASDALRAALLALLEDLLGRGWGLSAERVVTDEDLRAAGFDPDRPAPDPAYHI